MTNFTAAMTTPSDSSTYGSRDFNELVAVLSPNNNNSNNNNGSSGNVNLGSSNASNSLSNVNGAIADGGGGGGSVAGGAGGSSDVDCRIASSASGRSSRSNRSSQRTLFQQQHQQQPQLHHYQQQKQQRGYGTWAIESVESLIDHNYATTSTTPSVYANMNDVSSSVCMFVNPHFCYHAHDWTFDVDLRLDWERSQ